MVLGIISDYTINYNNQEFNISTSGASKEDIIETYGKYVSGYLGARKDSEIQKAQQYLSLPYEEFVIKIARLLLRFIYDVIERGRRRALSEMLLAATVSPTDESIRSRILNYLEATQYSESLENIISQKDIGLNETKFTFDAVVSTNEAAELRGQVARYLESYPDHPGLLVLRSISEIYCKDFDYEIVKQNFFAAINSATQNYSIAETLLFNLISWSISKITERSVDLAQEIINDVLEQFPNRTLARMMVGELPSSLVHIPAWFLLYVLTNRIKLFLDN